MSPDAARLGCRVLNVGTTPATITAARIVNVNGVVVTDFDSCTGTLQPGKSCAVSGPGQLLAGIVQVSGTTKNLRGTCLVLAPGIDIDDVRHHLPAIGAPVLFLAADRDTLVPAVQQARLMSELTPAGSMRVLEGHGHSCLIAPDIDLSEIIDEWVTRADR